jgi:hypothetical protein
MTEIGAVAGETYDIEINDSALEESGYTKFSLPLNGKGNSSSNSTMMILWHEDRSKIIYCHFYKSDLDRTVKSLEEKLLSSDGDIDQETAKDLVVYFKNECLLLREKDPNFFSGNGNNGKGKRGSKKSSPKSDSGSKQQEGEQQQEKKKRAIFTPRYTRDDLLAEAVIIGGRPMFAMAIPKVGKPDEVSITLQDAIEIDDNTVIRPPEPMSYISKAYTFKSKEEFEKLAENIKTKNLEYLYRKTKSIWVKYIYADDFHLSLCAADTLFTYFQDKIGLTHYLFFVGGNNSGKSNNLTVLHMLAYRNMMSSGMTAANIYQFLGSGEEGLGTICEDEADNIDEDHDKMRIYKNGYTTGIPYFRTDTSFGRQQLKFNTFGFKAFGAEKLPDSTKARGFNQRTIKLPCIYGFPQHDISEVVNPAGEEEYEQLLEELNTMRNALLVYRLIHFQDKIPNIKLNIQNREKQLFKPIIRLFQNTETLNELLPVISKYVSQKRESNANTLHAFLYRLIRDLVKRQNTYELESSMIWNIITDILPGEFIQNKKLSYESTEFGSISQKSIIETLIQVFDAKPAKRHPGIKTLTFDKDKLQRLGKIYELSIDVKVGTSGVEDVDDVEDVGLDKHIREESEDKETEKNQEEITSRKDEESHLRSHNAPQAPHPPRINDIEEYSCYYCNDFQTTSNVENYERHVIKKHPKKRAYPTKQEIEALGLEAQRKRWEI